MKFINAERNRFGVEPICRTLEIAPSSYYAAISRPCSERRRRDAELQADIGRVHRDNFGVYGARKLWRQLNREGIAVGRDRVARLNASAESGGRPPRQAEADNPSCRDERAAGRSG